MDGHTYIDLCLGDTGAMPGHSPAPVREAIARQLDAGITTMLPSENATWVGEELTRRFGLERWLFTLTATDANRTALRLARELTGRPMVLVYSYCYHGSVDESFAIAGADGQTVSREGNVGPQVDPARTTRAIEFNDLAALEAALAPGDVACVLAEPAMTNMGIVLPDPGYHEEMRRLTRKTQTLLVIDETHTFSAGPGGCTAAGGSSPTCLRSARRSAAACQRARWAWNAARREGASRPGRADYEDTGGVGGTLAGNALSMAAVRATLSQVLTGPAFEHMIAARERLRNGVEEVIERHSLPWNVVQLGARAEYRFEPKPARNGTMPMLPRIPSSSATCTCSRSTGASC